MTRWDHILDCEGLLCPLPVLRLRKCLVSLPDKAVVCLRATDPMAALDLPHFCAEAGHSYLGHETEGPVTLHLIRRGP